MRLRQSDQPLQPAPLLTRGRDRIQPCRRHDGCEPIAAAIAAGAMVFAAGRATRRSTRPCIDARCPPGRSGTRPRRWKCGAAARGPRRTHVCRSFETTILISSPGLAARCTPQASQRTRSTKCQSIFAPEPSGVSDTQLCRLCRDSERSVRTGSRLRRRGIYGSWKAHQLVDINGGDRGIRDPISSEARPLFRRPQPIRREDADLFPGRFQRRFTIAIDLRRDAVWGSSSPCAIRMRL